MKITRLSWAGLMIESKSTTIYIDPLQNVINMSPFIGDPKFPIFTVPFPKTEKANVLITHIHQDHFDIPLLHKLVANTGQLWGPEPVYQVAVENGLDANMVTLYETFNIGDFEITPVSAVDWIGDDQVSYVIKHEQKTIYHGGDTNWHGYWWKVATKYGPFDIAFLPVNGVVGAIPRISPVSRMLGTMSPMQAVTAARILGSPFLVPMHYGQFINPPLYTQYPDLENVLDQEGIEQNIIIRRLKDGETIMI